MNPPQPATLRDIGEEALIERITRLMPLPDGVAAGPGDDCAVIDESTDPQNDDLLILLKTDAIVESIHYLPGTQADRVGWKAVMRVASDIAAMGGMPDRFLITLGLPADRPVSWVDGLYQGMSRALASCGGVLAGGETTAVPVGAAAFVSVAATGRVRRKHLVLRSTAQAGDAIYVTGVLGGSFASGRHLDFNPRLAESDWLVRHFKPTAMMDVSDGLAADLPKLARASGVGFTLDRFAVPCAAGVALDAALNDGEDFELLFTTNAETSVLKAAWHGRFPELPLTRIGATMACPDATGPSGGWNHFRT